MSFDELVIKGARQNNLKNIDLALPHDKMIVVTGVSGSGKSSLAFDTVFAEGQWRFIESLSTYARLFLEKLDRPAVDSITNIRPAIALEQRNTVRGSRSTVGTATEVYDYLRLLFSKTAVPYCPKCGAEIKKWAPSGIVKHVLESHPAGRAFIIFTSHDPIAELKRKGFHRIMLNGEAVDLEDPIFTDSKSMPKPPYEVVLDRLVIRDEPRLADSVEGAFKAGHERMKIKIADGPEMVFSSGNVCDSCGFEMPEPAPILFSFNHPIGACPACKGFGNILKYSEGLIVPDPYLSISEGAIEPWQKPAYKWWARQMMKALKNSDFPVNKSWKDLSKAQKELIFKGQGFYGINDFFEELESKRYKLHVRVFLSRYRKGEKCPECGGKRLRPEALAYKLNGYDIAALCAMPVGDMIGFFGKLQLSGEKAQTSKEPLRQIEMKLGFLHRVGLGYLSMDRESRTLSGGEYQRVNLSNQLASRLTGTLYVLDEPTVGLHPRDTSRIAEIMRELSALGNTLLIVEHDKSIIESGDWIVELGPGGGYLGGSVVFSGPKEDFLKTDTITARYVTGKDRIEPPKTVIPRKSPIMELVRCGHAQIEKEKALQPGWIGVRGAKGNNLANLNVRFPLGMLTVVSGVSGSGKSSLVVETLYRALARHLRLEPEDPLPFSLLEGVEKVRGVRLIDQSPIGRTPRSNPVTYLKIFDSIRKIYAAQPEAKSHGFGPGYFSFNVPGGRCPACSGEGYQKLEMYFFEDLFIKCEACNGRRYGPEALGVHYKGRDINEVLAMTVEDARSFFSGERQITARLQQMIDIGLGYLRLGQPATTLSGGEAQRLKICGELGLYPKTGFVYFLDEPTVGLHYRDVAALLLMLRKLVEGGNTVIVIEHNLDVTAAADWVIDLGPEGGKDGGKVIFQGPPGKLVRCKSSYTGKYLKDHLS